MTPPRKRSIGKISLACMTIGLTVMALTLPCAAETPVDANLAALEADAKKAFKDHIAPFIKTYCAECHGDKKMKGGLTFSPALKNPGDASSSLKWEQAVANVNAHDMPPDEADHQPTETERQQFLDLIGKLKYLSPKDPGPYVIRRLTKMEYANTLRDLYGVDPKVADELPDEVVGEGYLNTLSPLQSEQYLAIANVVLERVLAPKDAPPTAVQQRLFGSPA